MEKGGTYVAYISGEIIAKIRFYDLDADDDSESSVLDAVFPDGWEGELDVMNIDVEIEEDEEDEY